jgi:hypothetical protein
MSVWGLNLDMLATNTGVSIEATLTLILFVGCFIFMARSFQLGAVMLFLGNGLLFMLCWKIGAPYSLPLYMIFISLILMTISIYAVGKTSEGFI